MGGVDLVHYLHHGLILVWISLIFILSNNNWMKRLSQKWEDLGHQTPPFWFSPCFILSLLLLCIELNWYCCRCTNHKMKLGKLCSDIYQHNKQGYADRYRLIFEYAISRQTTIITCTQWISHQSYFHPKAFEDRMRPIMNHAMLEYWVHMTHE